MSGIVYQLNVKPETLGERGLPKRPIDGAIITRDGVSIDFNRYRTEKKKSTQDRAVLLMSLETIQKLNQEGWPVQPGDIGENLTTRGLSYDSFEPGKKYRIGEALIQVSEACKPCDNLGLLSYVGDDRAAEFIRTLVGRRGWYARVLESGLVVVGDEIEEL